MGSAAQSRRDTFTSTPADAAEFEARNSAEAERDGDDEGVNVTEAQGCCVGGQCAPGIHPWSMPEKERTVPAAAGLTIHDELVQGSEEWKAERCGLLTASVVGKLITPTLKVADNDVSRGVTLALAAERITGHVEDAAMSSAMWRGVVEEPLAREVYAANTTPAVNEVGLMVRDFGGFCLGYSPDGLVGDDGLIEIKSRGQKTQVSTVLSDKVPAANVAQLQAGLLVSGRSWIDYVSFSGGMALWTKRVYPDPQWFAAITSAVEQFESAVTSIVARYLDATDGLPMTERTPDFDLEPVI